MSKVLFLSSLVFYGFSFLEISYIPILVLISISCLLLLLNKDIDVNKDRLAIPFLLSSTVILYLSEPLYENDHFRYFFEGKLFLQGINIYRLPPINFFLGAEQIFQKNLGFPEVPSIYGPLAHLFHGLSIGLMGFNGALIFIKSIYLIIFLFLWKKYASTLLLLCIPFLTKEFFNSIHLDFFAVLFILIGVKKFQMNRYHKGLLFIFLSLLVKPTGFIALPLIFSFLYKKMNLKKLFLWSIPYTMYTFFVSSWPAISIFAKDWRWNSGLTSILELISPNLATWSSLIAPTLFSIFIVLIHIRKKCWSAKILPVELGFIFFIQLLFSQTVNSWYLFWPLGFFLMANHKIPVVWISLVWPLCYAPWVSNDSVIYSKILFHLSGIFIFIYSFRHYLIDIDFSKTFFNLLSPFKWKVFTSN